MRITGNIGRTNNNDPEANGTEKGLNKASDSIRNHDYPIWENQCIMFTGNYYEALGGYIPLMANENFSEYFYELMRCNTN